MAATDATNPLGKEVCIHIDRECVLLCWYRRYSWPSTVRVCRLPESQVPLAELDTRRTYYVDLSYTSQDPDQYKWISSSTYEGKGLLQNVVQWNETTDM